jgi:trehalose-6-phosphate synthase
MTETPWNKEKLCRLVREKLAGKLFVVVSNREPYIHAFSGDKLTWNTAVGGLTEALDPVLRASGGTWVALGAGGADRQAVDANDRVAVPPDRPEYTLRRVWLAAAGFNGYYYGFANRGLWPLCHNAGVEPEFKEADWLAYQKVNRIFGDAVLRETGGRPAVVLAQDYHLALLPRYLKERDPDLTVGQFWHIPWPEYEALRRCPWYEDIVRGLLGNDLLGFQIPSFCRSFLASAEHISSHQTRVEAFPISVDFALISRQAGTVPVEKEMERLRREYALDGKIVGIGMDRLDYTKGIPERLRALDRFLADNQGYRGRMVYIMAGMPSRTEIGAYGDLAQSVDKMIDDINSRYGTDSYKPVVPMMRQLAPVTLNALRRLAHFCVVSSLHDGMNLVSKEYVAARSDGDGVLILSKFTGAAAELQDSLLINPYNISEFAAAIKLAIEMPETERRRRMAAMRKVVAANNIYRWGASIISALASIREG